MAGPYSAVDWEAVKERANQYNGLKGPPAALRAVLLGVFDNTCTVVHAGDLTPFQVVKGQARPLVLVNDAGIAKDISESVLLPANSPFKAYGGTLGAVFSAHPKLDQHLAVHSSLSHVICSTQTDDAALSPVYVSLAPLSQSVIITFRWLYR